MVKVKARRIKVSGNSYGILIPSYFIKAGELEAGKEYNVTFEECAFRDYVLKPLEVAG